MKTIISNTGRTIEVRNNGLFIENKKFYVNSKNTIISTDWKLHYNVGEEIVNQIIAARPKREYFVNNKKIDYPTYCMLVADGIACQIKGMTKAEIFKAAHKLAKTFEGNYKACFALALKQVYATQK